MLAAVLGIVRGHKGAIDIGSEPGVGTTFRILFPAATGTAEVIEEKAPDRQDLSSGTILLVDDEETVRKVTTKMLTTFDFNVMTAESGPEAMKLFRERADEIDAVILDLTMPHMDGRQVFREMRGVKNDVKIILSSGYSEEDVRNQFIDEGLAGFIHKPYRAMELIEEIRRALKQ